MSSSVRAPESAYDTLVAVAPQLLGREADPRAVSLLGQAVSDVLNDDGTDSAIRRMVADLESARADALAEEINGLWALPLAALLGLLRQLLHNRRVAASSVNPSSVTLKDRIIAALEAGVDTPTTISRHVHSPVTVVSRILRQLDAAGVVEREASDSDKRIRRYRLVDVEQPTDGDSDSGRDRAGKPGISDPLVLVKFASSQARVNARAASVLVPDLVALGSDVRQEPNIRVAALGAAGVMVRTVGGPGAADDALDLSESAELIACESGEDALLGRAAYERARAVLFASPQRTDLFAEEIAKAESYAAHSDDSDSLERLAWCDYSRCMVLDSTDPGLAMKYAEQALALFEKADSTYGQTAALVAMTRVGYVIERVRASETAFEALSLANRGGFLRMMAESAFWGGEVVSDEDPQRAERLFRTATQHFEAVGSHSWRALASLSLTLSQAEIRCGGLEEGDTKRIVEELFRVERAFDRHLKDDPSTSTSWAAAVFRRRLGSWARLAGDFPVATAELSEAVRIYRATANTQGETLALAGLIAAERGHRHVEDEDTMTAQKNVMSAGHEAAPASEFVAQMLDEPCGEQRVAI